MFLNRVAWAAKTLALRKASQLHNKSSLQIEESAHIKGMDREIAVEIIKEVRQHIEAMSGKCAVCYVLGGTSGQGHKMYLCKKLPLEGENWDVFCKDFSIPCGTSCFKCYLPTVSFRSNVLVNVH